MTRQLIRGCCPHSNANRYKAAAAVKEVETLTDEVIALLNGRKRQSARRV
jgi:hypothetical protein